MSYVGVLNGFAHTYISPVHYKLRIGDQAVDMNDAIGQHLSLTFLGEIQCSYCSRKIKKSYDGYCYPCFKKLPQADLCIMKPHECHHHLGTCRDPEFAETHCMIPHYVYLAVSSGVKVGITRKSNEMKRWVDQGAVQAVPIAEVPNRRTAGELEFALSKHMADKTDWRKMLKGEISDVDLIAFREEVFALFPEEFRQYAIKEEERRGFDYPLTDKVEKLVSYNLDKNPEITDRLIGIKGNYLIFAGGVLNIQKFTGYKVELELLQVQAEAAG